jgi:hypothetical protein
VVPTVTVPLWAHLILRVERNLRSAVGVFRSAGTRGALVDYITNFVGSVT